MGFVSSCDNFVPLFGVLFHRDNKSAVAFLTPCTCEVISVILNIAVNSHILRAQVAKVSSLALPELSVSTTALLSQNIWIILFAQFWPHTLRATTMFKISSCAML